MKVLAGPVRRDHLILRAISEDGKLQVDVWVDDHWKHSSYMLSDVLRGRILTHEEMDQLGILASDAAEREEELRKEEGTKTSPKSRMDRLASAMTRYLRYQSLKAAAAHETDPDRKRQYEEEAERIHTKIIADDERS